MFLKDIYHIFYPEAKQTNKKKTKNVYMKHSKNPYYILTNSVGEKQ